MGLAAALMAVGRRRGCHLAMTDGKLSPPTATFPLGPPKGAHLRSAQHRWLLVTISAALLLFGPFWLHSPLNALLVGHKGEGGARPTIRSLSLLKHALAVIRCQRVSGEK